MAVTAASGAAPSRSPVNSYLPWHRAVVDRSGRLLPWYGARRGLGIDRVLRLGWRFLERRVPTDQRARIKVYLAYAVFDERTLQGAYWQHNPASLYAGLVDSLVSWYAYSGDRRAVATVREMLDYQLAHGTTPATWEWPGVPFPTSCGGEREYGRCLGGEPREFYGGIEPDKVGLLGLSYLHFFELTAERRYLRAALACAQALARHVRPGDALRTPWPFRVDARSGRTLDGAEYGGMVVAPVQLIGELVDLRLGDTPLYRRAYGLAWRWLLRHPLNPRSRAWNRWSGFYEDVPYRPDDLNQALPTATALYLLTRSRPAAVDPRWRLHARALLAWVRTYLGRGPFLGAWGIDEQRTPGGAGCCSPAGLGSDTARWAAANALLAERTGDSDALERARRSLAYATYFAQSDGRVSCCGAGFRHPYWFTDGYGDYLGNLSRSLGALPELAPHRQNHLLRSTSVVQAVAYERRRLVYRTFAPSAVEVLRLAYRPSSVLAGGRPLWPVRALTREGFTTRTLPNGDVVVRVRHDRARTVSVSG